MPHVHWSKLGFPRGSKDDTPLEVKVWFGVRNQTRPTCCIMYGLEASLPFFLLVLFGLFRGGPHKLQLYPQYPGHPLQA